MCIPSLPVIPRNGYHLLGQANQVAEPETIFEDAAILQVDEAYSSIPKAYQRVLEAGR